MTFWDRWGLRRTPKGRTQSTIPPAANHGNQASVSASNQQHTQQLRTSRSSSSLNHSSPMQKGPFSSASATAAPRPSAKPHNNASRPASPLTSGTARWLSSGSQGPITPDGGNSRQHRAVPTVAPSSRVSPRRSTSSTRFSTPKAAQRAVNMTQSDTVERTLTIPAHPAFDRRWMDVCKENDIDPHEVEREALSGGNMREVEYRGHIFYFASREVGMYYLRLSTNLNSYRRHWTWL